ncbi:TadE/TadG family type IV pilus assembly protein [Massilia genomosp. 1]|uniref:TadE-like domain-containing protein n=1 Tax=Massilia genomosp. 1 TaxID=2609280 RepID=A0ABX0MN70_9BURK|nr:TadE/TadG family type IV pilus assembly protein [Massilia genomosp. 1]NHZ62050.1 hypothetical protein [Massilia genomosp. 1]
MMNLQASRHDRLQRRARQRGATLVEFAMTLPIFLLFMLGLFEVARAMYLWNALSDATHNAARAAAMIDANDKVALAALNQNASVAARAGGMALGATGGDARLVIAHLRSDFSALTDLPACPSRNIINCNAKPDGPTSTCVRYVQARLCAPGTGAECVPARYKPLFSGQYLDWSFAYPTFATVTPAGSLGHQSGVTEDCPAFN